MGGDGKEPSHFTETALPGKDNHLLHPNASRRDWRWGIGFRREKWGASSAEMAIGLSESFYRAGHTGRVALRMLNMSSFGLWWAILEKRKDPTIMICC